MRFSFDYETHLIDPWKQFPPAVCLTFVHGSTIGAPEIVTGRGIITSGMYGVIRGVLTDPKVPLVGANVAFDLGVTVANWPDLGPLVWEAFEAGRVHDVLVRQKLLDIAAGCYRGYRHVGDRLVKISYSLADVAARYGLYLDKGDKKKKGKHPEDEDEEDDAEDAEQHWRLRYSELDGVPLSQWPRAAIEYALSDAAVTDEIFDRQERVSVDPVWGGRPVLANEIEQVKSDWILKLTSAQGLRTDPVGVQRFVTEVETRRKIVRGLLSERQCPICLVYHATTVTHCPDHPFAQTSEPLVKPDRHVGGKTPRIEPGTRDTKAAKRRMVKSCREQGVPCPITKTGEKYEREEAIALGYVGLSADDCARVDDPILDLYGELARLSTVASKDVPVMLRGCREPIHTHFEVILETGRASSAAPNVMNVRKLPGIRECFVPRLGRVFINADFSTLELCTWAQVCKSLLGYSRLAEVLNEGRDPHLMVAAQILHCTYDEAAARRKAGDEAVEKARDLSKVLNFGLMGGMGAESFVDFARASGVRISLDEAKQLKKTWLATWPEAKEYFRLIGSWIDDPGFPGVEQLFVKRWRKNVRYTSACNTLFQGLGADAAKRAGWLIVKACFTGQSPAPEGHVGPWVSPLFGCAPVNFIHDEWMIECPEGRHHEAAVELRRLMVLGAQPLLPDVTVRAEVTVARRWSKKAKAKKDECGRLVPWDISLDDAFAAGSKGMIVTREVLH